ncbi:hypothetical protein NPIL_195371, partial [Nephila pilipes]
IFLLIFSLYSDEILDDTLIYMGA